MDKNILLDETVVQIVPGTARRISTVTKTIAAATATEGMVTIPSVRFIFKESHGDEFFPYPKQDVDSSFTMSSFYMDQFPVTNIQFKRFLDASHYKPADTANFLKHWTGKKIPAGMEHFPVVYVSDEDAKVYA